jgi:serine/threonine-protein phosphatase PP1 catalytic subunit
MGIGRPTEIPEAGLMADLLWSDPNPDVDEWGPSERGATITWGFSVAESFMARNNLVGIVRAHQMAMEGYAFPFGEDERRVVTVFTASRYAGEFDNKAAYMEVDAEGSPAFKVIPRFMPHLHPASEQREAVERPGTARRMSTGMRSTGRKGPPKPRQTGRGRRISPDHRDSII